MCLLQENVNYFSYFFINRVEEGMDINKDKYKEKNGDCWYRMVRKVGGMFFFGDFWIRQTYGLGVDVCGNG